MSLLFSNRCHHLHTSQVIAWFACLDVQDVYHEQTCKIHGCWSDATHTKNHACQNRTHTPQALHFPFLTREVQWALSWEHVTVFMACITGSWMHWMLLTVKYTPLSSHSFIQEDSLCILVRHLCNFPARFTVMMKQGNLYIFHCCIRHQVIFLLCVIVHMYLCTECVYETHSYCYLCM